MKKMFKFYEYKEYTTTNRKMKLFRFLDNLEKELDEDEIYKRFKQHDKNNIMSFLSNGRPSNSYIDRVIQFLKDSGIDYDEESEE